VARMGMLPSARGSEPRDAQRVAGRAPPGYARRKRDVYCFFDNTDARLRAPFDAQLLMRKLHLKWSPRTASAPTANCDTDDGAAV
jgi:hypothetical protein